MMDTDTFRVQRSSFNGQGSAFGGAGLRLRTGRGAGWPVAGFRTNVAAVAGFVLAVAGAGSAEALQVTRVEATNVTPSGFTVFWQATEPGTPVLSVFGDADGAFDMTADFRIEYFPLATGDLSLPNEYEDRIDRRNLTASLRENGLFFARVSLCDPATTYFVRAGVEGDGGGSAEGPAGSLLSVRTAARTAFVAESLQVMVAFQSGSDGLIATLETPAAGNSLVWAIGDAGLSNRAFFNLSDFIDPGTNTNLQFDGSLPLIIRLHRPGVAPETDDEPGVVFAEAFVVARVTDLIFTGGEAPVVVQGFSFSEIGTQTAGVPFRVTIRALDGLGNPVTDFTGVAELSATGELLRGGGATSAFIDGVLADYLVALESAGEHRLEAALPGTPAAGVSDPFRVAGSYDYWLLTHFPDPDDRENPEIGGREADPWATGVNNLLAYALGIDPRNPDRSRLPSPVLHTVGDNGGVDGLSEQGGPVGAGAADGVHLAITFAREKGAADVIYIPEVSDDLVTWRSGPAFTEEVEALDRGHYELVTARDLLPIHGERRRFMRLRVRSGESFAAWQARHFEGERYFDPDWSGEIAAPSGDDIANLMKYALGLDPHIAGRDGLPRLSRVHIGEDRFLMLSYMRPSDVTDIEYVMEVSSDMVNWESGSTHTEIIFEDDFGARILVVERDRTPIGEDRRFARLRVVRR